MRASFFFENIVAFRFRLISLTILAALLALLFQMPNASAQQREIVALNDRAKQLWIGGQKAEAITVAEKSVEVARSSLGADNRVTAILESQLGNFYRDV